MLSSDDKIIKEKDFVFNGIKYTARLYSHENKPMLYGEIVYSDNNLLVQAVAQFLNPQLFLQFSDLCLQSV